ncbi:MAG: LptF/LptG family permease [Candidatus Eisenbacteria bacterium]|nr:LptF/LptG family permease [Candidatus Eisenbacteria bacterium]
MRILERYVLKEHILPFLLGYSVVTLVIVLDFLFDYLNLIVSKGVPPFAVLKLFLLALGWITVLSFPCGVLVACLMTFGRMSQDNEITALRASGVPVSRLLIPVLVAASILGVGLGLFNNYVLPETNHAFATLNLAISRKSPTAYIREGVFIDDYPDMSLLVGSVDNKKGLLRDVTIYDFSQGDIPVTILARTGQTRHSADGSTLQIDLYEGEIHEVPSDGDARKYRRLAFDHHVIVLHNPGAALEIPDRDSRSEREMNLKALGAEINRLDGTAREREHQLNADLDSLGFDDFASFERRVLPPRATTGLSAVIAALGGPGPGLRPGENHVDLPEPDRDRLLTRQRDLTLLTKKINSHVVEVHKKYSIPFACLVFVLLGAPLGMRARRGGLATSAISIVVFIVYYLLLIGGEQLADRSVVPPALAMWLPNIVFGIPGVWLTWQAIRGTDERR